MYFSNTETPRNLLISSKSKSKKEYLEKHFDIQLQYAEKYSPSSEEESAELPDRQEIATMLENLPEEMFFRLDKAIRTSDVAGAEKSIEEIGGINPRLGRFL
jgi:hypothetical protein